jgi:hypothetical protein
MWNVRNVIRKSVDIVCRRGDKTPPKAINEDKSPRNKSYITSKQIFGFQMITEIDKSKHILRLKNSDRSKSPIDRVTNPNFKTNNKSNLPPRDDKNHIYMNDTKLYRKPPQTQRTANDHIDSRQHAQDHSRHSKIITPSPSGHQPHTPSSMKGRHQQATHTHATYTLRDAMAAKTARVDDVKQSMIGNGRLWLIKSCA